MIEGSIWFHRLVKESKKISSHIRFKKIKHGFYRIYYDDAYIGECYKEMPIVGHDLYDYDMLLDEKKYYEAKEDRIDLTRKIKNFIEGYKETIDKIRTSVWQMKHDKEFYEQAKAGYKQFVVK